jgi:NTE family protein
MSRVGLVLGGGGVTGASFHFGTLFALEMATGWDPNRAEVIVGTSAGAVVGAVVRSGRLSLDAIVGDVDGRAELAGSLGETIYRRSRPRGLVRWVRHGLTPGLRNPGLQFLVGSPAPYTTSGLEEWLDDILGPAANRWPQQPTIVVSYEVESRSRVAFGTVGSPDADLSRAVAASSAVPMVFEPVRIGGRSYVDGGLASGTSADLVLGADRPLDLVIVSAPMAALETRDGARFYERVVDRLGGSALDAEVKLIREAWPETEILEVRPDVGVLEETRPNPLSAKAAIPAFLRTLRSMSSQLAQPEVWSVLERHLVKTEV